MLIIGVTHKFSRTQASLRRIAPEHGQHPEGVLIEMIHSWNNIPQLNDEGVIRMRAVVSEPVSMHGVRSGGGDAI